MARVLREAGIGSLLPDLLTAAEDRFYDTRFDIDLLTQRLCRSARWLGEQDATAALPLGLFGASHLFEEPGALKEVARLAADWFATHFARS